MKEINWFNDFDSLRQKGLYVDYDEQIETPQNLLESDYLSVQIRVDRVYKSINELIVGLNLDNEKDIANLNGILASFKENDIYNEIAKFISRVKAEKSSPLVYTLDLLKPVLDNLKEESV